MQNLLESDYPRDIIENQVNERLRNRLFRMWWETGEYYGYYNALQLLRNVNKPVPYPYTQVFEDGSTITTY